MPLTGLRQYSTATGALRKNPSLGYSSGSKYLDQNFKLMFVYPVMFEEKTSKFQATRGEKLEPYENIIRDFLSANFLKEIFVSNAIDVVSMASQIRPLRDEEGGQVDTTNLIGNYMSGQSEMQQRYIDQAYRMDIEYHLKNKISSLRSLLRVDPQTSVLNPQVDMVLLQNLVEVPVITGTKPFKISSIELFYVLVGSIVLRKPLNSIQNVNDIFSTLDRTSPEDFWKLLNNLAPPSPEQRKSLVERLRLKLAPSRAREPRVIVGAAGKGIDVTEREASAILNFAKRRFSMTKYNFQVMVDPALLRRQTGVDVSTGQMAGVVTRINPERNAILSDFETNLMQDFSTIGNTALRSFANIYHPQGSNVDYISEHRKFLQGIHSEIHDIIRGNLYACMEQSLGLHSHEGTLQQTKVIKKICSSNMPSVNKKRSEFSNALRGAAITTTAFDIKQYGDFLAKFEDIASASIGLRTSIEASFDEILNCGDVFNDIRTTIDTGIRELFDTYTSNMDDLAAAPAVKTVVQSSGYDASPYTVDKIKSNYIIQARRSLNEFYLFLFFAQFQKAFCRIIEILDVEVKTAQADVTDWPNYTLVVPIEMLAALNAALNAKGWNNLIGTEITGHTKTELTSESYVKGMVRYLAERLAIPNLIVIDRKKRYIYTKLMHQSQVVKMNLQTLNAFIKEMENIRARHAL